MTRTIEAAHDAPVESAIEHTLHGAERRLGTSDRHD
jgi:hypothetical protein